jgi:archaellum component FlaG (FlaF/FlaG flagellin family)
MPFCLVSFLATTAVLPLPAIVTPHLVSTAQAQTFRFSLRAEPDLISANGISTTTITVQVQNSGNSSIMAAPVVRFVTTAGTIEPQAQLSGGVARALLRSSTTPGTAIVTAFVGNSREQIAVEFTGDEVGVARYLEVSGSYVAYGAQEGLITASGGCQLQYGDLSIESDVRLDVDLHAQRIWAEGGSGRVIIRNGKGTKTHELRGDRLYYDLQRRRGILRRSDTGQGAARQDFMDHDFKPVPGVPVADNAKNPVTSVTETPLPESVREPDAPIIDSSPNIPLTAAPPTIEAESRDIAEAASEASERLTETRAEVRVAPQKSPSLVNVLPSHSTDTAHATVETETQTVVVPMPAGERLAALPGDGENLRLGEPNAGVLPSSELGASGPATQSEGVNLSGENRTTIEQVLPSLPEYRDLPTEKPIQSTLSKLPDEPTPPKSRVRSGYWVVAKRMRVFPHDKVQFENSSVFFNGIKLFSMPRYVASLKSAFSPATDMASFNSSGGLTMNVPYYYMASPRGTGTLYLQHAPSGGFAAEKPGFALALDQQYWMSNRSQGRLIVDQIGRGGWNLNWEHRLQFSPTSRAEFYLDMPRHRDAYLRSAISKEFRSMQIGFEGLMSRVTSGEGRNNMQGQFYARLRPKMLGGSGWSYTLAANVLAQRRFTQLIPDPTGGNPGGNPGNPGGEPGTGTGRPGGGTGRPGGGRSNIIETAMMASRHTRMNSATATIPGYTTRTSPLLGQTLLATFSSPNYKLWRGASLNGSLLGNLYNYSDGRRGFSPGLTLGLRQDLGRLASLQLDYNYDKGSISALTSSLSNASYTHFISGSLSMNLSSRLAGNAYFTRSLSDRSFYGVMGLDYYFMKKWRAGLFSDYSSFDGLDTYLNYGLSIGRQIGQRELTVNWSRDRNRIFFELGGMPY